MTPSYHTENILMSRPSSFNRDELLSCGNGDMFGLGNARLPVGNMLMMDRITHISDTGGSHDKGQIIAELDINPDLWFFDCHFPTDPVMPGCLGLDAMWQFVGFYLGWKGQSKVAVVRWDLVKLNFLDKCYPLLKK